MCFISFHFFSGCYFVGNHKPLAFSVEYHVKLLSSVDLHVFNFLFFGESNYFFFMLMIVDRYGREKMEITE